MVDADRVVPARQPVLGLAGAGTCEERLVFAVRAAAAMPILRYGCSIVVRVTYPIEATQALSNPTMKLFLNRNDPTSGFLAGDAVLAAVSAAERIPMRPT